MSIQRKTLRKKKMQKTLIRIGEHWQLYLMMLPALIYLIIFLYKPMYGVIVAFKNYKFNLGIWGSPWLNPLFKNFTRFFNSYWFPIVLKNTVVISFLSLVFSFPAPILLALMVNEIEKGFLKKGFQTISYAPHFISTVVVCGMITMFLSPESGVLNQILKKLNLAQVQLLQNPKAFKWCYVVSGIWQDVGWSAIIYFAALAGVDKELLEAAQIDGASRFQRIIHINLPVLKPTIVVLLVLSCGSLLSVGYEKVYLLQNDMNITGSEVISTYVYKMGLQKSDFSFSTAVGLFNSIVNCIILLFANSIARRVSEASLW